MDQGMNGSAGAAVILAVLGASGVAAAGVRTEYFDLEAVTWMTGGDVQASDGALLTTFRPSMGSGELDRWRDGPGSSFVSYQLGVSESHPAGGRLQLKSGVADRGWMPSSMIGSGTATLWRFRTSEPSVLQLRGLFQWSGDALYNSAMEVAVFDESGAVFTLNSSDPQTEINATIEMPPGLWGMRVHTGLGGSAAENGPGFAARSSLDLDFRIVPAPATLAAFVGFGLMGSRRRR